MIAKPFGQHGRWHWIFTTMVFYIRPGMAAGKTLRLTLTCGLEHFKVAIASLRSQ